MVQRSRGDGRPGAAAAVGITTWALALAAVAFSVAAGAPFAEVPWYAESGFFALYVIIAATTGAGAAAILWYRDHPAGAVTGLIGLTFAFSVAAMGWSLLSWRNPELPGAGLAVALGAGLSAPASAVAMAVLPWYLREKPPTGRRRLLAIGGAVTSLMIAAISLTYQQPEAPNNPFAISESIAALLGAATWPTLIVWFGIGMLGVIAVLRDWRRTPREHARGYGVMAVSIALVFIAAAGLQLWPDAWHRDLLEPLCLALLFAAQLLLALSVVVVVLGAPAHGLAGAIPRATVYGLLSSVVVALYVAAVAALGALLPISDQSARTVVVAVLALVVHPLRQWLQSRVDRVVYGDAGDPVRLLTEVGENLRSDEAGLDAVVSTVRRGLRLGWLAVETSDVPIIRATSGRPLSSARPDQQLETPLVVRERRIGLLRAHSSASQRLDERVSRALASLGDVIALSLELEQTNHRLREASHRLGEVRHEERRMLRRELHDGMGPALAGIGLGLAAAQRRLHHDPDGAHSLLDDLRREVARRTEDVRLLARSLLPAQLDDADLPAALAVLAERFTSAGLEVTVAVTSERELSTREQIAIYHIAAEALLNAHRHARASRVRIRVDAVPSGVRLEIRDDGCGIAPDHRLGVGLISMRERADGLGARLAVEAGPSGTGTLVTLELR